jgi:hypothetical protein
MFGCFGGGDLTRFVKFGIRESGDLTRFVLLSLVTCPWVADDSSLSQNNICSLSIRVTVFARHTSDSHWSGERTVLRSEKVCVHARWPLAR